MSAALVFLTVWYIIRASGEFSDALIILFEMENRMIITVTLNPAIDKTVTVEKLRTGELHKVLSSREDAGGKGINVSKTIKSLGGKSIAVGFLGGAAGERIKEMLRVLDIEEYFTHIQDRTRTNLKIADQSGVVTELNEPGPRITQAETEAFCGTFGNLARPGDLVIVSGSMPGGISADFYARLVREVHALGAEIFVDADGMAFAEAVKAVPDIVKPNLPELKRYCEKEGLTGAELAVEEKLPKKVCEVLGMGNILRARGIAEVIVSMGADGAVFLTETGNYYTPALSVPVCSTVGAGDAMVAAYAYARMQEKPLEERIRFCVAVSAGAVTTQGTNPAKREDIEQYMPQVQLIRCR